MYHLVTGLYGESEHRWPRPGLQKPTGLGVSSALHAEAALQCAPARHQRQRKDGMAGQGAIQGDQDGVEEPESLPPDCGTEWCVRGGDWVGSKAPFGCC